MATPDPDAAVKVRSVRRVWLCERLACNRVGQGVVARGLACVGCRRATRRDVGRRCREGVRVAGLAWGGTGGDVGG